MKLKEYPESLLRAWSLRLSSPKKSLCRNNQIPCIVSLTSISSRLQNIDLVIRSLLVQDHPAEKIILWLNSSLEGMLPKKLIDLQSDFFEIRYRDQTCPHRKLVFSLQELTDKIIVTCDDDIMYNKTWLGRLYKDHLLYPNDVIAHECRAITVLNQAVLSYHQWPTITDKNVSEPNFLPIGYGGVLYPAGVLHSDVTDASKYMALAPKADDLWFKAMSFINNVQVRRSSDPGAKPLPIIGAKGSSLATTNIAQDGNRIQWQAICDYYQIKPDCSE